MNYRELHLTKAVIDLKKLDYNLDLLKNLAGGRKMYPAIKANAYGHGSEMIGKHLVKRGYTTLCVAHMPEAIELIESGIKATFIVLSPTIPSNAEYFAEYDLEPVICTIEMMKALDAAGKKAGKVINAHAKIDTGMGRVGMDLADVKDFFETAAGLKNVKILTVMSHFPKADERDKTFSKKQYNKFLEGMDIAKKYGISTFHFANSAAIFDLPEAHFDLVRPGISIYGLKPSLEIVNRAVDDLKPILSLETRITYLKNVPEGTGISYGHTYYTKKPSLIATLPIGYGDGLMRSLTNKLDVLINGRYCPQVGRICMDQCLVDVTSIKKDVQVGDRVVIIGESKGNILTADELASKANTINYEITTNIQRRVPRIYEGLE